ncbi:MAG: NAD(P)-dependent oxidoreductase [Prevotella sp.]|jgi:nucleoside-diphosphate-sugar epimerase|nr:NAD(P)-dependent oxidoreductase [Prevotella sp.]MCH3995207.1 NAD(P)-dependent oxidoreductase [Prevotella sp.]MCI1246019.1 NAD(P)-dependent oxidoreductase [Prevotella sp.]
MTVNRILEEDINHFVSHFSLYEELRGKSLTITGATGLLGSCMVRCLLALNTKHDLDIRIVAVVRNVEKAQLMFGKADEVLSYYVCDFSSVTSFAPIHTDYLIHFASPTASKYFVEHPVETLQIGVNGIERVLDFARKNPLDSVVFISSMEVYGSVYDDSKSLQESEQGFLDPMLTRSSYPMAKRAAECFCRCFYEEYQVPVKVARLAQTFGAGVSKDDHRVFAQFSRAVLEGKNIQLYTKGEVKHCYCYTMDAVSGILYILLHGKDGEAYNVANEQTYISIIDMARFLCREFNPQIQPVIELKENMGYPPTTKLRLSTQKIRTLGWVPEYDLKRMFERLLLSMKEDNK